MENRDKKYQDYYYGGATNSLDGMLRHAPVVHPRSGRLAARQVLRVVGRQFESAASLATVAPGYNYDIDQPINMNLPGEAIHSLRQPLFKLKKSIFRIWAMRGALSALAMLVVVGGWLGVQAYINLHKTFNGGSNTVVALKKQVDPNQLDGEGDGRVNILLLGNGGPGHEAPDLTDTLMVASIDPVNHKMVLLSVPRDLWINLPGHGHMKLNAAFETGKYDYLGRIDSSNANEKAIQSGFASVDQAMEQILGIKIHYNVLVNFISFRKAVNTVGGINVNVPETLYDPTMAWENGWSSIIAEKGSQHFDGHQALLYSRSRETSTDFDRSMRQRLVLEALKNKAVSLGTVSNPLKLSSLMNDFGDNVRTDLSISQAARVYQLTKNIPNAQIRSLGVGYDNKLVTTGRIGDQSVVMPVAGLGDYAQIHNFVRQHLPDGFIVKENAKIKVLDATIDGHQAGRVAKLLKSYGYNVTSTGIYPGGYLANTEILDYSHDQDPYTQNYLETRFNTTARPGSYMGSSVQAGTNDFIIVIGSDEAVSQ